MDVSTDTKWVGGMDIMNVSRRLVKRVLREQVITMSEMKTILEMNSMCEDICLS